MEKIKEYTGADEEFIALLFEKFLSHLDEDLEILRAESVGENWVNVRKKTHAMQSSARIFHLDQITQLSTEIETKVDDDNLIELKKMIDQLIALYDDFRAEVNTWLENN